MRNYLLFAALLLSLTFQPAQAQRKAKKAKARTEQPAATPASAYAATITPEDLRKHLTILASDEYEGRATGEKGQKLAADYLARQFAELGLEGPMLETTNPYLQPFGVVRYAPDGSGTVRVSGKGGKTFESGLDFISYGPSAFLKETKSEPVFLGFGIETDAYNDYAARSDVKGKDVVLLQGEPTDVRGHFLLSNSRQPTEWSSPFRKAALARDKGARSVFIISFADAQTFRASAAEIEAVLAEPAHELTEPVPQPLTGTMITDVPPTGIPTVYTSMNMGAALLGTTIDGLGTYIASSFADKRPPRALAVKPFVVRLPQQRMELASENVLGLLEGTDKQAEVLVISAHYDHIGIQNDTIYNGADDDGSGVSAVLELAQAFAQAKAVGQGPRRSILFALMSGEERGLLGSDYYTGHPVRPLAQTIANLNIDMVGRTDTRHRSPDRYVYLVGSDKLSSELHAISEAANAQTTRLRLDYHYNQPNDPEQLYYRSDHYNFARHGIPVIFYTSGLHTDYHKATDDVERIEFDKLAERARLVFHTAWELANRDARIVVDSAKP
jgi:hypothetical protein